MCSVLFEDTNESPDDDLMISSGEEPSLHASHLLICQTVTEHILEKGSSTTNTQNQPIATRHEQTLQFSGTSTSVGNSKTYTGSSEKEAGSPDEKSSPTAVDSILILL